MRNHLRDGLNEFLDSYSDSDATQLAARAMCTLRSTNQEAFDIALTVSPIFTHRSLELTNHFMNGICERFRPRGASSDTEYFYGGQCAVPYNAKSTILNRITGARAEGFLSSIPGPIAQFYRRMQPNSNDTYREFTMYARGVDNVLVSTIMGGVFTAEYDDFEVYLELRRADGLPDNCGDTPPPVPSYPMWDSPSIELETNIRGIYRPVTFNFPGINTTDPDNVQFDLTVNFEGITVSFSSNEVDVVYEEGWPSRELPPPPINDTNIINNVNNISTQITSLGDVINNEFETLRSQQEIDIQAILDAIERCCCKEGATYSTSVVTGPSQGGRYPLPERTVAVVIAAETPFTANTPFQEGSGSAQRVYHWGSHSINYAPDCDGIRIPLQFALQSIPVAERAVGVTLWPTYQNQASIFAVVREESE